MKNVFLGTPEFCLPSLEALYQSGREIAAVVTRPDRPAGRGRRVVPPPAAVKARELGIPVYQPNSLSRDDFLEDFRSWGCDLLVSVAFGQFIPARLLESLPRGGINLHPSLLPRYRGAAPVAWALIRGEEETGVTVHYLSSRVDAGPVLASAPVAIEAEDDCLTLSRKLFSRGAELLLEVVAELEEGRTRGIPQDESLVTRAPRLSKEDGRLDWRRPAGELHNLVRGLHPWPGAFGYLNWRDKKTLLKILKARPVEEGGGAPGRIEVTGDGSMLVGAGEGALEILELQLEGKRALPAREFLRGHREISGRVMS